MGRIIAVGDSNQAIYAFRGADCRAISRLVQELNATVLPLSICYRCPKSVIRLAQTLVPDIEACDNAPEGEIINISDTEVNALVQPNDYILCRVTAPLVKLCYSLLRDGKRAYVKGRDIGQSLITFIEKLKAETLSDLIAKIDEYQAITIPQLMEMNKESEAILMGDRCETIKVLAEGCTDVPCIIAKIDGMFADNADGICLSTVHKAKGLEASTVFILCPEKMPHPMAKTDDAIQQEKNIQYVAYTRVKFSVETEGKLVIVRTTKKDK